MIKLKKICNSLKDPMCDVVRICGGVDVREENQQIVSLAHACACTLICICNVHVNTSILTASYSVYLLFIKHHSIQVHMRSWGPGLQHIF